ncbi:ABC transporter substrate-binding protein [Sphingomonas sp. Root710]|uniref:substrate-binding periplasmic protein n=1 Tax=Sphingomonas sp. Root710 TaxID=1736594 RepID=UPI0006FB0C75|nr:ABC transporter substrate-binding protein [Sphingomonas sp. Root710]KRB85284.1 ABC transporter substrate-binding protein [Sphingomonas sp. Root710]
MISRRSLLVGAGCTAIAALLPERMAAAPLAKVKALGVLRVAVYRDNAPWSSTQDGKVVGIDADIARAIAAKLGVRVDLAEITADEGVEDDLRNAVWKGGLLGFMLADMMLHIPFDRTFASRNDQVAIVAPYYRESFQFACASGALDCEAPPTQWRGRKLAAELDSIPDFYLLGAFGGILSKDVVHYLSGAEAVSAAIDGRADAVLASRAQIEAGVHRAGHPLGRRSTPLPAFTSPGWDIAIAVKENSRTLGDAVEDIMAKMASSGELKTIFADHGVGYAPALALTG